MENLCTEQKETGRGVNIDTWVRVMSETIIKHKSDIDRLYLILIIQSIGIMAIAIRYWFG